MNRINCSEIAARYLKEQAPEIPRKPRGLISIKGKGEMNCFWVNEKGTAKDSALERIRANQKLKLLQQEIDQWRGETPVQAEAMKQELGVEQDGPSGRIEEPPSEEFDTMENSLKDRLRRAKKYGLRPMKFS